MYCAVSTTQCRRIARSTTMRHELHGSHPPQKVCAPHVQYIFCVSFNYLQQVDKRSDAIRKCGAEIVKLRKHVEVTDQERRRLDSQLKALHMSTAGAEMVSPNCVFPSRSRHIAGYT